MLGLRFPRGGGEGLGEVDGSWWEHNLLLGSRGWTAALARRCNPVPSWGNWRSLGLPVAWRQTLEEMSWCSREKAFEDFGIAHI